MQPQTQTPPKLRDAGYSMERYCPRCAEYWPADGEFFHARPSGALVAWCRACSNEYRSLNRKVKS